MTFRLSLLAVLCPLFSVGATFEASIAVDPGKALGAIDPNIYGQYLEHVDSDDECIYPSIWDGASPLRDPQGLRRDVVAAVRSLSVPIIRWPGGCFADVYHWENGIGDRNRRPVLPNLHWKRATESHQFGTDEFLRFCELTGAKPYINVNLGSGTLEEALRWLEYCNGSLDTEQGRRRAANGRREPYDVLHWGVGNETWGPWEKGHTDADTYSRQLAQWAKAMKKQDPRIRILGVGSSEGNKPDWDRSVLANAGEHIDYLTLHTYGFARANAEEYENVVYTPDYMETRVRKMLATIDEAAPAHAGRIRVSVDEWNIRRVAKKLDRKAPRNMQDGLFVAGVLNTLVRLSPRVGMANYVFLVNGHAPLLVNRDQVVRTPLFHLFSEYGASLRGKALAVELDCPSVTPPRPQPSGVGYKMPADYQARPNPVLNVAAARDERGGISVAIVNRHATDAAAVTLRLPKGTGVVRAWTLHSDDPLACNDFAAPERIVPVVKAVEGRPASWTCPPRSVVVLRCGDKQ